MDISYIINPPTITDTEAAQILSSMSPPKETYYGLVTYNIFWKLSSPPPVTYIKEPIQEVPIQEEPIKEELIKEEMSPAIPKPEPSLIKIYPRRIRNRPRLSISRLSIPKPPSFKKTRENPLGLCHYCRGLYVIKHMERHQMSCDGTLKWCRYDRESIDSYLEKYETKN